MFRRRRHVVVAVLALLVAVAGVASAATKTKAKLPPIKIGLSMELTGAYTDFGSHAKVGAEVAASAINHSGGVNGRKIELLIKDNRSTPEQAVIVLDELAASGVVGIVGPVVSTLAVVAFPETNRRKLVSISPGSAREGLTAANRPWAFRNTTLDKVATDALVKYLKTTARIRKVGIIIDGADAYASSYGKTTLPASLDAAGVRHERFETQVGQRDFSVSVTAAKNAGVDSIALCQVGQGSAAVMKEIERQGLKVPVFGCAVLATQSVLQAAGAAAEGVYATQSFFPGDKNPRVKQFLRNYAKRAARELPAGATTVPSYIDVGAWESVVLIARALSTVPPTASLERQRTAIQTFLTKLKGFKGLGGPLSMNADGDVVKKTYVLRVKNGVFVKIGEVNPTV